MTKIVPFQILYGIMLSGQKIDFTTKYVIKRPRSINYKCMVYIFIKVKHLYRYSIIGTFRISNLPLWRCLFFSLSPHKRKHFENVITRVSPHPIRHADIIILLLLLLLSTRSENGRPKN